ncbi:hypothetical protein [Kitasatospora sp. NPDC087314]|uniref:hypothetical protein n=1 Tax=Kitasatospora sp. NPDC087314 TaxID=3364068 RepID=UPI00381BB3BE
MPVQTEAPGVEKRTPRRPFEGGDDTRAALEWGGELLEALDVASGPRPELTSHEVKLLLGYMNGMSYEELGQLAGTNAKQVNAVYYRISTGLRMKGRLQAMFAVLARCYVRPEQVVPEELAWGEVSLSADTVALLTLLACNLSQEDAAAKLGLRYAQAQYLLLVARAELCAKNSHHAILIAAVLGVITVPGVPRCEVPKLPSSAEPTEHNPPATGGPQTDPADR